MASFRQMSNVVTRRNTLEVERENFEKTQTSSVHKAVNPQEMPVKQKHIRSTILGSHQEHGAGMFWSVISRQPLQGNPIVCWKFCHVLHKLLRDGHPNVIADSLKYCSHLSDLGRLWGHLRDGYGRLIACYTSLLEKKLTFHKKYKTIPGNMVMTKEMIAEITGNDPNGFFELAVDLLDYMDEILSLQTVVFGSLDMSRSNSMTSAGQCRLAPLIACIQESAILYDHIVKLLFKLHAVLPPDTLGGHRDRFSTQFKSLKQFYYNSQNLQYFKNLVQVPSFPENPPNFLVASDIHHHRAPVVVVPGEDSPDLEPPEVEKPPPPLPVKQEPLIVTEPSPPQPMNGVPQTDHRDLLIEKLKQEIEMLQRQIITIKAQAVQKIESLNEIIQQLENELKAQKEQLVVVTKEKVMLQNQLEMVESQSQSVEKMEEVEKIAKKSDEKFTKLKEIYGKLREEHVTLLRQHAESNKQLNSQKKTVETLQDSKKNLEAQLQEIEQEKSKVQEETFQKADDTEKELITCNNRIQELEKQNKSYEGRLADLEKDKISLQETVQKAEQTSKDVSEQLEQLKKEKQILEETYSKQSDDSTAELAATSVKLSELEKHKQNLSAQIEELEKAKSSLNTTLEQVQSEMGLYKSKYEQVLSEKEAMERELNKKLEDLRNKLFEGAIAESQSCLQKAVESLDQPLETGVTCTAEFLLGNMDPILKSLFKLKVATSAYGTDQTLVQDLVRPLSEVILRLSNCLHEAKAVSTAASIEEGEELLVVAKQVGEDGLKYLSHLQQGAVTDAEKNTDKLKEDLEKLSHLVEGLVPKVTDVKLGEIGEMVDDEMHATVQAIEAAAKKIEEMLHKSREADSGVKLEVNERILDSCTNLMLAIRILVHKAKEMQEEIVVQGRGSASEKDFYKRHHRWTEGLLSAAKAVGWGANVLLETAEKVVSGNGKFEELMVCSQEIAASTAQLVVASKVKADRGSLKMKELSEASKGVSQATAKVVASAKTGAEMIEESDIMDFSHLTLHQAKRLEMNSQVRVLELESLLEKERMKFGELRRKHYQLAAESTERDQEEQKNS